MTIIYSIPKTSNKELKYLYSNYSNLLYHEIYLEDYCLKLDIFDSGFSRFYSMSLKQFRIFTVLPFSKKKDYLLNIYYGEYSKVSYFIFPSEYLKYFEFKSLIAHKIFFDKDVILNNLNKKHTYNNNKYSSSLNRIYIYNYYKRKKTFIYHLTSESCRKFLILPNNKKYQFLFNYTDK